MKVLYAIILGLLIISTFGCSKEVDDGGEPEGEEVIEELPIDDSNIQIEVEDAEEIDIGEMY